MKKEASCSYKTESDLLKKQGPLPLYFIYGREDYLRDYFVNELKALCTGDSGDGFGYYRFDGMPEKEVLSEAVDTMPFLSDRTFVEIRNADFNKLSEETLSVLSEIPEYCTVTLIADAVFEPDNRTKCIKFLREKAHTLHFGSQVGRDLDNWVARRFKAAGKSIGNDAIKRLEFISGEYMNALIPEIDKLASYVRGDTVTIEDVNAIANHIPEASAFDLVDRISSRRNNEAVALLSELLKQKGVEVPEILGALSYQFRQLYAAKVCEGKGLSVLMDVLGTSSDYRAKLTAEAASRFRREKLKSCINVLADAEYRMKTSANGDREELLNSIVRIMGEEA